MKMMDWFVQAGTRSDSVILKFELGKNGDCSAFSIAFLDTFSTTTIDSFIDFLKKAENNVLSTSQVTLRKQMQQKQVTEYQFI